MIFIILAFIALILSICIKDRKKSLFTQSLSCLFEAIYGFIINAFTGAVLSIVNFIRTFIFIQNEKIVLFEDFARDFLDKDLTFAIELKVLGIEQETIKVINKYKTHNNIYITSFLYDALKNARKIDSNIKLSWLIEDRISKENIENLLKINGTQICPRASLVSKEDIEFANNNGVGVRLWGINNEEIMQEVCKLNIEGMTVNFPNKLIELLNKEK